MYHSHKVLMLNNQVYALIETSKSVTNVNNIFELTERVKAETRSYLT